MSIVESIVNDIVTEFAKELAADLRRSGCCLTSDGDRLDIDLMRALLKEVDGGTRVVMWKIRDKQTGLFAPGGSMGWKGLGHFTKKGKTWSEKRFVTQHMANNQNFYRDHAEHLEIVKMVLQDDEVIEMQPEYDALIVRLEDNERKKQIANQKARLRRAEETKRRAEAEIAKLKNS
jgi:hypothetical protein